MCLELLGGLEQEGALFLFRREKRPPREGDGLLTALRKLKYSEPLGSLSFPAGELKRIQKGQAMLLRRLAEKPGGFRHHFGEKLRQSIHGFAGLFQGKAGAG